MRRKPLKPRAVAWILTAIYLIGVTLGIWVVCYLVSGSKRAKLTDLTYSLAANYQQSQAMDAFAMSGRSITVYSPDGEVFAHAENGGYPIHLNLAAEGQKYAPKVLNGENVFRLVLFAPNDTTLGYTSLLYIGVPLTDGDAVTGAFFWVMELRDLLETLLAFLCTFTAVFAVVTVFVLQNLNTQRKYEQMRRHYIDNITHELKTPVASIKALAEALSDGMEKSPNDRSVYYGMILREANRQERMICDVLELSKLQSYQMVTQRQHVSAAEVFRPTCDKYATLCDLMGITFTVSDEVRNLPDLLTDSKYVPVILDALLSNALKFVPEGGEISISAQLSRKRATVCIADNGKGIPKEELPYVFERFYKGSRSDNEAGSGLGLAIAREIADNLREKLWIRSEEGKGTQAYFTLTLKHP